MGIYQSLSGQIRYRLTSADVAGSFHSITEHGIAVTDVIPVGELEAEFTIPRRFSRELKKYASKSGDRLTTIRLHGVYWSVRNFLKRPVLFFGCLMLCVLAYLSSGRILFVDVEGNDQVSSQRILEAAKESGICFGANRRQIRSEVMKNHLLSQLPQLQWAGVNTYGCRAVITVRERNTSEIPEEKPGVSSIVAVRDGIVTSCTVTEGTAFCVPGQAVTQGQVLISGYSDRGLSISATHAKGEVTAATRRNYTALTPKKHLRRTLTGKSDTKYSLIIGKKRINFYKGSGISGAGCVKMYSKYVLSLPGGFSLPVSVVKVTIADCSLKEAEVAEDAAQAQLTSFSEKMLNQSMISGTITDRTVSVTAESDCYVLDGWYACTEMIGGRREEMIGEYNGKSYGTDRERGSGG